MREEILTRLREALQIATEDLSTGLDHFRELVEEVVERVDGIALTGAASDPPAAQPLSRLRFTAFSTAGGEPVREFLLIPFGEIVVERPSAGEDFVFTRAHAESAKRWFEQMGRKLAVDYEHQSFDRFNTRSDGLRPAAGWIGGLDVRDDGLWAVDVTWTERAGDLLRSGEYRYFSPVIFWTDEDRTDVAALGPVALTNDPAMRGVCSLAATRQLDETSPADDGDSTLEAAQTEITLLRRQLAAQEADTFVERGMRQGKILESNSMDWRADYLRDAESTEERLSRAPVLRPPGRMIALDRRGDVARLSQRVAGAMSQWALEPEDLTAYEQAAAAGRVSSPGR